MPGRDGQNGRQRTRRAAPLLAAAALFAATTVGARGADAGCIGTCACVGDCAGDGAVQIYDLVTGINILLGAQPIWACQAFAGGRGIVDVAQLVTGVDNALNGCDDRPFADNHDGTITDQRTALTWEKKVARRAGADGSNLHAADNTYAWAGYCALAPAVLCQPTAAAAAACQRDAGNDHTACAQCAADQGACEPRPDGLGLTTIWQWLVELNAARFAGHDDWRIPTPAELASIISETQRFPAVHVAFDGIACGPDCVDVTNPTCSCVQSGGYWSATISAADRDYAWYVSFAGGGIDRQLIPYRPAYSMSNAVRAVRGGLEPPRPRYVDTGIGTIVDRQTHLEWEKLARDGSVHDVSFIWPWGATLRERAAMLNEQRFAGRADWRAPTRHELESLIDYTRANPAIDEVFNRDCAPGCTVLTCSCTQDGSVSRAGYWAATWDPDAPALHVRVTFDHGGVAYTINETLFARAVRTADP